MKQEIVRITANLTQKKKKKKIQNAVRSSPSTFRDSILSVTSLSVHLVKASESFQIFILQVVQTSQCHRDCQQNRNLPNHVVKYKTFPSPPPPTSFVVVGKSGSTNAMVVIVTFQNCLEEDMLLLLLLYLLPHFGRLHCLSLDIFPMGKYGCLSRKSQLRHFCCPT